MVKRYTYRYADDGDLYRHEEPDGKYVLHDDYAALESRNAELREAVRWERNAMRVFNEACMPDAGYGEITWAAENLEKARAAVDALVGGE